MATITLYDRVNLVKRGAPVQHARFELRSDGKNPRYTLMGERWGTGPSLNEYHDIYIAGTRATLRITDLQHGNRGEFTVPSIGGIFWL